MSDNTEDSKLSKDDHILNYAKSIHDVEQAILPYREHKRALKQHYTDNGFLTKTEMSQVLRAYRMLKKEEDIEDIAGIFNVLKGNV